MNAKFVKRAVVTGALLGAALIGDVANIGENAAKPFQSEPIVEQGYLSPKAVKIVSKETGTGRVATYLVYNDGGISKDLPLMNTSSGPRLGDSEYVLSNLTEPEKGYVFEGVWRGLQPEKKKTVLAEAIMPYNVQSIEALLSQEQKKGLLNSQWAAADNNSKSALITGAWPSLEVKYRHSIVRQELDQLLVK
jgi:hypothetical protein